MKTFFLLPNRFKTYGWFLFIPSFITLHVLLFTNYDFERIKLKVFAIVGDSNLETVYFKWINTYIEFTFLGILILIGGLLIMFSREKNEDEFISNIRLSSLQFSVFWSYVLLLFCFIFVYGLEFMKIMLVNMFVTIIIFVIRFNYLLYKYKTTL